MADKTEIPESIKTVCEASAEYVLARFKELNTRPGDGGWEGRSNELLYAILRDFVIRVDFLENFFGMGREKAGGCRSVSDAGQKCGRPAGHDGQCGSNQPPLMDKLDLSNRFMERFGGAIRTVYVGSEAHWFQQLDADQVRLFLEDEEKRIKNEHRVICESLLKRIQQLENDLRRERSNWSI